MGADPQPPEGGALLVTSDPGLARRVSRLAAAASAFLDISDAFPPRARRPVPRLVLVGADAAMDGRAAAGRPPGHRRERPIVVAESPAPDSLWRTAVEIGAEFVAVLPEAEPWLLERFAELDEPGFRPATVVGVIGARGGAGASVLAAALARTAIRDRRRSLLVDLDPFGGGADLLLGAEDEPGLRWPDLATARGRLKGAALLEGFPSIDGMPVLSWDRGDPVVIPDDAVHAVIDGLIRATDLVVVDLPRNPALAGVVGCEVVLLVVPAEVRAVASARRIASVLGGSVGDVRLVVRGPAPTGLAAEVIADALDLPLAAALRPEPGIGAALDRGEPPGLRRGGPLSTFCRNVLDELFDRTSPASRSVTHEHDRPFGPVPLSPSVSP